MPHRRQKAEGIPQHATITISQWLPKWRSSREKETRDELTARVSSMSHPMSQCGILNSDMQPFPAMFLVTLRLRRVQCSPAVVDGTPALAARRNKWLAAVTACLSLSNKRGSRRSWVCCDLLVSGPDIGGACLGSSEVGGNAFGRPPPPYAHKIT